MEKPHMQIQTIANFCREHTSAVVLMDVLCMQGKKTTNCMVELDHFVILEHTQHHLLAQTVTGLS